MYHMQITLGLGCSCRCGLLTFTNRLFPSNCGFLMSGCAWGLVTVAGILTPGKLLAGLSDKLKGHVTVGRCCTSSVLACEKRAGRSLESPKSLFWPPPATMFFRARFFFSVLVFFQRWAFSAFMNNTTAGAMMLAARGPGDCLPKTQRIAPPSKPP